MPANVRKTDLHLTNTTIFLQKERSTTILCKKNKLLECYEEATTLSSSAEQTK